MAKLVIVCEVNPDTLRWQGQRYSDNIVDDFNTFYREHPQEAFELAIYDEQFKVISAEIDGN